MRNAAMSEVLKAYGIFGFEVKVFAFHSNYAEKSRGTRNMLTIAKKVGLEWELFEDPKALVVPSQLKFMETG